MYKDMYQNSCWFFVIFIIVFSCICSPANIPISGNGESIQKTLRQPLNENCPDTLKVGFVKQCLDTKDALCDVIVDYTQQVCTMKFNVSALPYPGQFPCPLPLVQLTKPYSNETQLVISKLNSSTLCHDVCDGANKIKCAAIFLLSHTITNRSAVGKDDKFPVDSVTKSSKIVPVPPTISEKPVDTNVKLDKPPQQNKPKTGSENVEAENPAQGKPSTTTKKDAVEPIKKPQLPPRAPVPPVSGPKEEKPITTHSQSGLSPDSGMEQPQVDPVGTVQKQNENSPNTGKDPLGETFIPPETESEKLPEIGDNEAAPPNVNGDTGDYPDQDEVRLEEDDADDVKPKNVVPHPKISDSQAEGGFEQSADQPKQISSGHFVEAEDSHFFVYFLTFTCFTVVGYIAFHNKNKILALVLEGRRGRPTRRRPNSASYRKLDSLEEAMMSHPSHASTTHVIY